MFRRWLSWSLEQKRSLAKILPLDLPTICATLARSETDVLTILSHSKFSLVSDIPSSVSDASTISPLDSVASNALNTPKEISRISPLEWSEMCAHFKLKTTREWLKVMVSECKEKQVLEWTTEKDSKLISLFKSNLRFTDIGRVLSLPTLWCEQRWFALNSLDWPNIKSGLDEKSLLACQKTHLELTLTLTKDLKNIREIAETNQYSLLKTLPTKEQVRVWSNRSRTLRSDFRKIVGSLELLSTLSFSELLDIQLALCKFPNVSKRTHATYSYDQDQQILKWVASQSAGKYDWKEIADRLQRTPESVRKRYACFLDPSVKHGALTREEEEFVLTQLAEALNISHTKDKDLLLGSIRAQVTSSVPRSFRWIDVAQQLSRNPRFLRRCIMERIHMPNQGKPFTQDEHDYVFKTASECLKMGQTPEWAAMGRKLGRSKASVYAHHHLHPSAVISRKINSVERLDDKARQRLKEFWNETRDGRVRHLAAVSKEIGISTRMAKTFLEKCDRVAYFID